MNRKELKEKFNKAKIPLPHPTGVTEYGEPTWQMGNLRLFIVKTGLPKSQYALSVYIVKDGIKKQLVGIDLGNDYPLAIEGVLNNPIDGVVNFYEILRQIAPTLERNRSYLHSKMPELEIDPEQPIRDFYDWIEKMEEILPILKDPDKLSFQRRLAAERTSLGLMAAQQIINEQ